MKRLIAITFIVTIISSCSQNSSKDQTTDQQEPTSELSSAKTSNQNIGNWKFLLDSRWAILLKDSVNGQSKYIQPACLSTSGHIGFAGKLDLLNISCGQDGVDYKITSIENKNSSLIIEYSKSGRNGEIEIFNTENFKNLPYKQITVRVTDIEDLLLGYYPNNILELNRQEVTYISTNESREVYKILKEHGLYSKLPCDEEDEY